MKKEIMYVELKSGFNDNGPAWISYVAYSKSGQTIYFNGKAFKKGSGISGNFHDLETREEYWISGVKKNQQDRHWAGSGKVMIDRNCIDEYLRITGKITLDERLFEIVSLLPSTPAEKFHEAENKPLPKDSEDLKKMELYQLSKDELNKLVEVYSLEEGTARHNEGRGFIKKRKREEAEKELEKRIMTP